MYSQQAQMAAQKPETFMLSTEAQQALPHDAQVALQQVDNCKSYKTPFPLSLPPFCFVMSHHGQALGTTSKR
jgi:transcription factor STE12